MKKYILTFLVLAITTTSIHKLPTLVHICVNPKSNPYECLIKKVASDHGVDPKLALAIAKQESQFNPRAKSKKGAYGLMQLMPITAKHYNVDQYNIKENVLGGVLHIKRLRERFGDTELVLAAYNAGETRVAKYKAVPPFPETKSFIKKVMQNYREN